MKFIDIVMVSSDEYAPYLATTILSVLENMTNEYHCRFHVITDEIRAQNKQKIALLQQVRDFTLEYYQVDYSSSMFDLLLGTKVAERITPITYCKVILPTLFPNLDKFLFLDIDLIVRTDIAELFSLDIGNYYFAAVEDTAHIAHSTRLWGGPWYHYFNTGVMIVNARKMREDQYQEAIPRTLMESDLCKYIVGEQDILNDVFHDKFFRISLKWNFYHEYHFSKPDFTPDDPDDYDSALANPAIIHFVGAEKPWMSNTVHPYKQEWTNYYKKTPFYNRYVESLNKLKSLIYLYEINPRSKKIQRICLFGLPIKQQTTSKSGVQKTKYLGGLFKKIKKPIGKKKYYLLGIKIWSKNSESSRINQQLLRTVQTNQYLLRTLHQSSPQMREMIFQETANVLAVQKLHSKTFPPFKGIHDGESIVIVGTGPTLKLYEPIQNAIHISLNRAFYYEHIKFNYAFAWDYYSLHRNYPTFYTDIANYNCKKFFGLFLGNVPSVPKEIITSCNAYTFYSSARHDLPPSAIVDRIINYDIESFPLMDFMSIAFAAFHFALYTNPKHIYLVGLDSALTGSFDGKGVPQNPRLYQAVKNGWNSVKKFTDTFYPHIQITSINPVGLTGLFHEDRFTENQQ